MSGSTGYSPELRERAVRMATEIRADYTSEWATFVSVSKFLGTSPGALRTWVRKAQIDSESRPGLSSDERANLKALEDEREEPQDKLASLRIEDFNVTEIFAKAKEILCDLYGSWNRLEPIHRLQFLIPQGLVWENGGVETAFNPSGVRGILYFPTPNFSKAHHGSFSWNHIESWLQEMLDPSRWFLRVGEKANGTVL